MGKIFRYLTTAILCILFLVLGCIPVYAKEEFMPTQIEYTQSSVYNTYIKYSTLSLSNIDGKANCTASVTGYAGVTNVKIYLYLQKYSSGSWTTVSTFSDSALSNTLTISKKVSVSSGKYRLKVSYYANSENIVKYSGEKSF